MNHYQYIEKHFQKFLINIKADPRYVAMHEGHCVSDGGKCYQYQKKWEENGVPFNHGVAIYMLTHMIPWTNEVRETPNGWVAPDDWVISKYEEFKPHLV